MSNITVTPVDRLKNVLNAQSVQDQFKNALREGSALFTTSIIDLYNTDTNLQKCQPKEVVVECLKAATLKLPINKNLGFAYIIPFNKNELINGKWEKVPHPQFQLGYRGYIQLAMRTGFYKYINAGIIYEGMKIEEDFLSGAITITGKPENANVLGYFSYFKMLNGFEKAMYWSKAKVLEHAQTYSKSYIKKEGKFDEKSSWATNFNEMAQKTLIRYLISHFGMMSVDMIQALTNDSDEKTPDQAISDEIEKNANSQTIDIEPIEEEENKPAESEFPAEPNF